jgi:hypothetical protein
MLFGDTPVRKHAVHSIFITLNYVHITLIAGKDTSPRHSAWTVLGMYYSHEKKKGKKKQSRDAYEQLQRFVNGYAALRCQVSRGNNEKINM